MSLIADVAWSRQWWDLVRIGCCQGLISAAVVALLLVTLRSRSTARFRYLLLMLLLIKFALPPLPGWGLFPFLWTDRPTITVGPISESNDVDPAIAEAIAPNPASALPPATDHAASPSAVPLGKSTDWALIGMTVHCAGTVLLLAVIVWRQFMLWQILRRAGQRLDRGPWINTLSQLQQRLRMRGHIELWILPPIQSPVACGIFRRRILLPTWTAEVGGEQQAAILGHELAHHKRGDAWAAWLENVTLAWQWWNPLVYVVRRALRSEREKLCDAMVLTEKVCDHAVYAHTLLDAVARLTLAQRLQFGTEMVGNGHRLNQRLEAIMSDAAQRERKLGVRGIAVVALTAAVLLPGLPMPSRPATIAQTPKKESKLQTALHRPVSFDFTDVPLEAVIDFLSKYTGVKIVLDPQALQKAEIDASAPVTLTLEQVSLGNALHLVLLEFNLSFLIHQDELTITDAATFSKAAANQKYSPREDSAARQKVEQALVKPFQVEFVATPLHDVLAFLRDMAKVNVALDRRAMTTAGLDDDVPISGKVDAPTLEAGLKTLLSPSGLQAIVRYDVLLITTKSKKGNGNSDADAAHSNEQIAPKIQKVLQRRITCDFQETPLSDVCGFLREYTAIDFVLDQRGLEIAGVDKDAPVTLALEQVSMANALHLLLLEFDLTYVVRDNAIVITDSIETAKKDPPQQLKIGQTQQVSKETLQLERVLQRPSNFDFIETPLIDVIDFLCEYTSTNIVFDRRALKQANVALDVPITKKAEAVPLSTALRDILSPLGLEAVIRHDVLLITTKAKSQ